MMEDNNKNSMANIPKMSTNNDSGSSPDWNILSPISKSRYGRTRKPKITEDFYNIDVILESADFKSKRNSRSPQLVKPIKLKTPSPKKSTSTIMKPNINIEQDFEHVTGDYLLSPEPIMESPQNNELNSKAIHNFFKSESGMSILQNAAINNEEVKNKLSNDLNLESVDVTQVLKIISVKNTDENIIAETKVTSKPVLKTYSNKRKSYIKSSIVESFGLPDTPIFPLQNDKLTEPKRIKNLDVAPPTSENDINLVDKKLLDTPWKIASMDAEMPALNILLDTANNDYKEDDSMSGCSKLLNNSVSIFDDSTEINSIQQTPPSSKSIQQDASNIKMTDSAKKSDVALVPNCNKLFPKLKQIVQNKILINSPPKINKIECKPDIQKTPTVKVPKQHKKSIQDKKTAATVKLNKSQKTLRKNTKLEDKNDENETKETKFEHKNQPDTVQKSLKKSKSRIKKLNPEIKNSEILFKQDGPDNTVTIKKSDGLSLKKGENVENSTPKQNDIVAVNKNDRLSLKKKGNLETNELKLEEVTPPVTSPINKMRNKGKQTVSRKKSHSVPKTSDSEQIEEKRDFLPRRGRSAKVLNSEKIENVTKRTLRKRISKSAETIVKSIDDTPLEPSIETCEPTTTKTDRILRKRIDKAPEIIPQISFIPPFKIKDEEIDLKIENDDDENIEYIPPKSVMMTKGKKKKKERISFVSDKEENSENTEIKFDSSDINVGDLMWAKIGGHPFWPCIVTKEPTSNEYIKTHYMKNTCHNMYHVRFFGDKGRRSWVHALYTFPFTSKFGLKNQYDLSKNKANFIVKPSSLAKWTVAVKEAELQLNSNVQQRLEFFNQVLTTKKSLKKQPEYDFKSLEIKEEQLDETDIETVPENKNRSKPRSKSLLLNVAHFSAKMKKNKQPKNTEASGENQEKLTTGNENDRKSRSKSLGNVPYAERKNKNALKNVVDAKPNSDSEVNFVKEQSGSGTDESNEVFLKNPWKTFNIGDKNLDAASEYSLSDTDSLSKSSSSTPIPNSFHNQMLRQRKNNLFRGVNRDRVCQICKLGGEVFKCKGPCNGMYHYNCALIEIKQEEIMQEDLPDSTQTNEVQIKSIVSDDVKKPASSPIKLSLAEQIDMKMKEVMQNLQNDTRYADSTTDYSSSEESIIAEKPEDNTKPNLMIKHVTADHVSFMTEGSDDLKDSKTNKKLEVNEVSNELNKDFQCKHCVNEIEPPCYACNKEISSKNESFRQKCSLRGCGKYYHPKCLKLWPQTQWSLISTEKHKESGELLDTFVCPLHVCHTCASDDPHAAVSRCGSRKVAKCLRCPATYHTTNYCIPAGTQILSTSQIICPRHFVQDDIKKSKVKPIRTINTPWCFICSKGGELICCETCPTSVHTDCLTVNLLDDDTFICEDCETGRFPLYDEIVWVKLGKYRWWPAVILFPNEIPANVKTIPHNSGEFVVKFFGTHDHYWVGRGRVFLFQEGDKGHCTPSKKRVDALFKTSIEEATAAHNIKKIFRKNKEAELKSIVKPPPFIRVKVNKPVGNVRQFDGNISNTTSCECNPLQEYPCGPDSDCINRLLMTECDPNICPAREKCNNQRFEKRQYPSLEPYKTQGRGWGLKTLEPIAKGDFVIEYVGEIVDDQEYQRRVRKMHEQKDENYYFLIIDKDRIIDAGPKGNLARFMNHCCQPNCETQKWTVNGDTRVGLFAIKDIPVNSEVTFNYNLECIGKEKKICKCGAPNCSGFIGVKVKDESQKKIKKTNIFRKKKILVSQVLKNDGPCFICGKNGEVGPCHNKICTKFYHLQCVNLESWPEGKWVCPWHNCNVCTKRTIRCCVKCTNSYCPVHSENNVRYDKLLGFVCSEHDSTKEPQEPQKINQVVNKFKCTDITDETDVTSTTGDEIDCTSTKSTIHHSVSNMENSITSTPIKNSNLEESLKELENILIKEKLEIPESSIPEDEKNVNAIKSIKRKKRRSKRGRSAKRIKLSDSMAKPVPNFNSNNVIDIPTQNEVKLCSSIPTRHLRTRSSTTKIANKRFLGQQSELEKDLPIRKRSRPRCEVTN